MTFGVDHIVSGVAINILALGVTQYLADAGLRRRRAAGGAQAVAADADARPRSRCPGLSDWLATLEKHHWFLVSDLAGILGGLVTDLSPLT